MHYGSALKQDCEVVPCLSRLGDAGLNLSRITWRTYVACQSPEHNLVDAVPRSS
jgi:hypothetical protein